MHRSGRATTINIAGCNFRKKTIVVIGAILLAVLFCNHVVLIHHLAILSDTAHDMMTSNDTSRIGVDFVKTVFGTTQAATVRAEKTTQVWKKILRNISSSRIGIHVLRPEKSATNIIVLGERHSGTTFFTKYLSDCFPNANVQDTFINNKHWAQHDPAYLLSVVANNGTSVQPLWRNIVKQQKKLSNNYFEDSFVIVLFRNPYDWVEAMRRKPWHWPNHLSLVPLSGKNVSMNIKAQDRSESGGASGFSVQKSFVDFHLLDWKDFVNRPLQLEKYDGEENNADLDEAVFCQKGYAPNAISPCRGNLNYVPNSLRSKSTNCQALLSSLAMVIASITSTSSQSCTSFVYSLNPAFVVPCLAAIPKAFLRHLPFDTHNPIYEHNPTDGRPFENLLQLRAFKVMNYLRLPERWEMAAIGFIQYDSLLGNNLEALTDEIGKTLGSHKVCSSNQHFEKGPYNLTDDFVSWINKSVQWKIESLIGYHRS